MKILYLITKANFGGAQRYVYDLATHANTHKHEVAVGFGGTGLLEEKLHKAGIRTISLPSLTRDVNTFSDLRSLLAIIRLLRNEQPDVLHLNSSKVGGIGSLAGRIYNITQYLRRNKPLRIIFTGHGWAFTEERPDIERAIIALFHSLTIQLAHRTIAVSRKTREEVARIPFTRQKMTVIYNGISKNKLRSQKEALGEILGKEEAARIPKNALIIGTLGELHKNKGHAYALEALAILKRQSKTPFRFIVVGEGEERNQLEKLRETLGLKEEVFFPGFHPDSASLLSAFDIFLFPSIKEGFPYAILEAGNAGLPVVTTTAGGIPEVIDDMESGILIHSKNPGEIARALAYLIENPLRRTQFGEAIAKRIHGRFTSEIMAQETFALYEK